MSLNHLSQIWGQVHIVPQEPEIRLLLLSWLDGQGPALYWLLDPASKQWILNWLASELVSDTITREARAFGTLLKLTLEGSNLTEEASRALRGYRNALELAHLMQRDSAVIADSVILGGLRHPRDEVRAVAKAAMISRLADGNWSLLNLLKGSSSPGVRNAYFECAAAPELATPASDGTRVIEEFRNLHLLVRAPRERDAALAFSRLKKMRVGQDSILLGEGMLKIRRHQVREIGRAVQSRSRRDAERLCRAFQAGLSRQGFRDLLRIYESWNIREAKEGSTPAVHEKSEIIAQAVLRTVRPELIPLLSSMVQRIRMTPSSRSLILGLLRHGKEDDVYTVLKGLAEAQTRIDFRNHTELGQAVARRMMAVQNRVPEFLLGVIQKAEFWVYSGEPNAKMEDRLGLGSADNRALYIRIAGYATIGAAGSKDIDVLFRLVMHEYGLVARAAVIRLTDILGPSAFKQVVALQKASLSEREARSFAGALRDAEIEHFGLAHVW
jgi:hypothetical protein